MNSMRYFLLAITAAQLAKTTNNDENALELNIFCAIANMAKDAKLEDATASDLGQDYEDAWRDIQAIYTMTSNETYYEKGPVTGEKDKAGGGGKEPAYDGAWKTNKRKEFEDLKTKDFTGKQVQKYLRRAPSSFPQLTAIKIQKIYEQAAKLNSDVDQTTQQISAGEQAIVKAAHEALYGEDAAIKGDASDGADSYSFQADHGTACKKSAAAAGATLASDMVCLCASGAASQNADTNSKICDSTDTTFSAQQLDYSSQRGAITAFGHIMTSCSKKHSTPELNTANINNLLHAFRNAIGRHPGKGNDDHTYRFGKGKAASGSCSGDHTNIDVCIRYAAVLGKQQGGKDALTAIKWVDKLLTVKGKLETREQQIKRKQHQQSAMITLAAVAEGLYEEAAHGKPQGSSAEPVPKPQKVDPAQAEACEKRKNNKTACESTGKCEWKGKSDTEGNCKPKEGEGQKTQGPNDGAAGGQQG
uniref:Variant surface glycoprotein (VSG), putative n=1 Tax=Trypanosoma brucei brucei (strain 927/4 GUTat10.1) TaxID=185431 RepID=Q4FKN4_TRYB2|nr:variant surface glycoprotein (VSG), putative [Trypanosoma brucei brucei TREU927]